MNWRRKREDGEVVTDVDTCCCAFWQVFHTEACEDVENMASNTPYEFFFFLEMF